MSLVILFLFLISTETVENKPIVLVSYTHVYDPNDVLQLKSG